MAGASAGSLALHLAVIVLLIFGRPWLDLPPPPSLTELPVELVEAGPVTTPSTGLGDAGRLQEKPPETRPQPPPAAPPAPERSAPPAAPRPRPAVVPRRRPPPDDFTRMLDALRPQAEHEARRHSGPAARGGAADPEDSPGRHGQVSVKDFLRAQIERHWEPDLGALGDAPLVLSLHLVLRPDGSVRRVELVDDPRYGSNPRYRPLGQSLRRAALVAAPLRLPAGVSAAEYRDVVLSFDPRKAVR